jgi:hypothetical protein
MHATVRKIAERFLGRTLLAEDKPKKKRMVVLMGPPAAGKGFFTGEPDKDKPGTKYGWKFPQSTHGLFTDKDIPEHPEYDESDNHLRQIQFTEAEKHFKALKAAHAQGKEAFEKALEDHWYRTKDGDKIDLSGQVDYDSFPKDMAGFSKAAGKFYVSMRGWHDDTKEINPETGKPKERFKDEARNSFDDSISLKTEKDNELLIVDSAGEDIDAQDYRGQIEKAKANGYEVTVIFLHPEQADTELSNLARGRVQGKRMVDQADIDNWYQQNKEALEEIQKADPDNFLHYRKPPPDPDPAKAAEMRKKARDLMLALPPPPVAKEGEPKDEFKARRKKWEEDNHVGEINNILYGTSYGKDPERGTSWGRTLDSERVAQEPKGDVAKAVAKLNGDAEERANKYPDALIHPPTGRGISKEEDGKGKEPAEKKDEGRGRGKQDFLKDMRGKKVPNPNPDSKKRFPQVLLTGLPWEHQKPYYEKWKQQQKAASEGRILARRVAHKYMEIHMAADKPEPDFNDRLMRHLQKSIETKLKVNDKFKVQLAKGPVLFVTLEGAESDLKTMKHVRKELDSIVGDVLKKQEGSGYPTGFKAKVTASNKGEDLWFQVEVMYPEWS